MNLQNQVLLVSALLPILTRPVVAQVEQVAIRTTGISCGMCAAVSEIHFKRMPGVDEVTISLSTETIVLTYKPGATFAPQQIRQILQPLEVQIIQFQVSARGRVQEEGGKRFFIASKDKFVLANAGNTAIVPADTPVLIVGIVNDGINPAELRIFNFKVLKK